jgi:hypothetical protein
MGRPLSAAATVAAATQRAEMRFARRAGGAFDRLNNQFLAEELWRNRKSACAPAQLSVMLATWTLRRWPRGGAEDGHNSTKGKQGEDAMSIRIVVATVLVLGTYGALSSGARAETQSDRDACIGDVHEHCGEFIPNRDAIVACLKQKIKKISHACRVVMTRPYPKNAQRN